MQCFTVVLSLIKADKYRVWMFLSKYFLHQIKVCNVVESLCSWLFCFIVYNLLTKYLKKKKISVGNNWRNTSKSYYSTSVLMMSRGLTSATHSYSSISNIVCKPLCPTQLFLSITVTSVHLNYFKAKVRLPVVPMCF